MNEDGDEQEPSTIGRRKYLEVATVAGAIGVAGCSGLTHKTYTASSVEADGNALGDLGFEQTGSETVSTTKSRNIGPIDGSVTAESELAVFSDGESEPTRSPSDRWNESDSPLASWAGNRPVRGLAGPAVLDDATVSPADESLPFDAAAADGMTLLYPDDAGGGDGSVAASDVLVSISGSAVRWGDRESGGTVALDEPAQQFETGTFTPEDAVFAPQIGE